MATVNLGRVVGKSAYEVWLDAGNTGTEADYLESLKGEVTQAQLNAVTSQLAETGNRIDNILDGMMAAFDPTVGKNLFNPDDPDWLEGKYIAPDGTRTTSAGYSVTGYIPVTEGDVIKASYDISGTRTACNMRFIAAYDASKVVQAASGSSADEVTYTVPAGISYLRISYRISMSADLQIEIGHVITAYEPYLVTYYNKSANLPNEGITHEKMYGVSVADGYNIVPSGETGDGVWYWNDTAMKFLPRAGSYANYMYHKVSVEPNSHYTFSSKPRWFALTDISGGIVSYDNNGDTISCDTGATGAILYVAYDVTKVSYVDVCKGYTAQHDTMYVISWLAANIPDDFLTPGKMAKRFWHAIPGIVYIDTANPFKLYYRNVLTLPKMKLWVGTTTGLTTKYHATYVEISAATAGSRNLAWKIYDDNYQTVDSGTMTVLAKSASGVVDATVLVIGDSTIDQDTETQGILDLYTAQSNTLTLLGTNGVSPNLHEGRAGWTAANFGASMLGANPFYNNGFDFSYYMTQQGYAGVTCVVIQLGINDVFGMNMESYITDSVASLAAYKAIVDSVLAYDSGIKIIVSLPIPPNSDGTTFTAAYGTQQIEFAYRNNIIHYAHDLMELFANYEEVTFAPSNCVLDTDTDINDGVHPNAAGYDKLAKVIFDAMNAVLA